MSSCWPVRSRTSNVVRIHDLGDINGIKYIAIWCIDGVGSRARRIKRERRAVGGRRLAAWRGTSFRDCISAHEEGVVHRDLKPANIMLQRDGEVLIMDFGIARSRRAPHRRPTRRAGRCPRLCRTARSSSQHEGGAIVGTVEYMAPEQARGETVNQRADIYAFGLILLDALTGQRRSTGASAIEELQRRMVESAPPVRTQVPAVPAPSRH